MTKNLSPPKIFETYLDTKTNDTSDFIVNLFENIEKEIEHNRGISLVLLEQVLENIPSIVAQIDETIKANQYTQYIGELLIQNHPRIHILKTKTTQGLHSLWNLNIYLAAQESHLEF